MASLKQLLSIVEFRNRIDHISGNIQNKQANSNGFQAISKLTKEFTVGTAKNCVQDCKVELEEYRLKYLENQPQNSTVIGTHEIDRSQSHVKLSTGETAKCNQ